MTGELDANALERALAARADAPDTDPERIELQIQLAWAVALRDKERTRELSEAALRHAQSIGHERLVLLAQRNLNYLGLMRGENLFLLSDVRELVERLRAIDEIEGLLSALDILFYCWESAGDYTRALEVSLETKTLAEKWGRRREKAWALNNIGVIHTETGDLPLAEQALMEALDAFNAIQYPTGVVRTKSMLGRVYHRMGRIHDALAVHIEVLALYRDLRLPIGEAQALNDIALILEELGRPDHALERYRAAAKMFGEAGNRQAWGRVYMRMARLTHHQEDTENARGLVLEGLDALRDSGPAVGVAEALEVLARIEDDRGDTGAAAAAWREAWELQQQIHADERRLSFERIKTRVEVERAERDAEVHRLKYVELASLQSRLIESERFAVVGDLAAGVAHEVNNPLGVLRSSLDVIRRATDKLEGEASPRLAKVMERALSSADEASTRIQGLAQSLKRFSRLDEAQRQIFDVNAEIENVLTLIRPRLGSDTRLATDLRPLPPVEGVPQEINQALMTLLVNAIEATPEGEISVTTEEDDAHVRIEVRDTGRGMNHDHLEHLFEPGFVNNGGQVRFRVGLPSAAAALRRHGGDIQVESEVGVGTCFVLTVPVVAEPTVTLEVPSLKALGLRP